MTQTPEAPQSREKNRKAAKGTPKPEATQARTGKDFGLEGTNKTVPVPQPDAQPADELQGTKSKHVSKTPYIR